MARTRSCLTPVISLAFLFAACMSVPAQVNGVPPSISSIGFGGSNALNHVAPPSVTSLAASGYGKNWSLLGTCCANVFWPGAGHAGDPSHHHRRKDPDLAIGVVEPAYIPYAADDAAKAEDDPADDSSASYADPRNLDPSTRRRRNYVEQDADFDGPEQRPVDPQPATVLIFKDGHKSDVLNYAIVGNTLFDFSPNRTRKIQLADLDLPATLKANDDRGVDFRIPANTP
jgi:hypothetical protein